VPGQIPPLAKSDFLARLSKDEYIRGVLMGRSGPIVVNGKPYNGTMIPMNYLNDSQVANVLTYVRNSWGNSGEAVSIEEVSKLRKELAPTAVAKSEFE
jgi:nitrite reductase (NO-forming)